MFKDRKKIGVKHFSFFLSFIFSFFDNSYKMMCYNIKICHFGDEMQISSSFRAVNCDLTKDKFGRLDFGAEVSDC